MTTNPTTPVGPSTPVTRCLTCRRYMPAAPRVRDVLARIYCRRCIPQESRGGRFPVPKGAGADREYHGGMFNRGEW